MSTLNTILKIHRLTENQTVHGAYRDSFEVVYYDYQLEKAIDKYGNAAGTLSGGQIKLALPALPNAFLMKWMLDIHKFENGEISTHNGYSEVVEKIAFEDARLTGVHFNYDRMGAQNVTTVLTLNAQRIFLGDNEYKSY